MTLSDTQQAILVAAIRHPEGLATPPAHLPPAPRTAIARSLLRAGLLAGAPDTRETEANLTWRVDGAGLVLRITDEGRRTIGDQHARSMDEDHEAGEPKPFASTEAIAPAHDGGVSPEGSVIPNTPEVSATPDTPSTSTRRLRDAAQALLVAWDDGAGERAGVPGAMERLRALLAPAVRRSRPAGGHRSPRADTKQARVLAMLHRPGGATVAQVAEATEWAPHTVRGFFAGLKKKGIQLETLERVRVIGPDRQGAKGSYTIYHISAGPEG